VEAAQPLARWGSTALVKRARGSVFEAAIQQQAAVFFGPEGPAVGSSWPAMPSSIVCSRRSKEKWC